MKIKYILLLSFLLVSCSSPRVPDAIVQQQAADMQAARDSRITADAIALQAEIDRLVKERSVGANQVLAAELDTTKVELEYIKAENRRLASEISKLNQVNFAKNIFISGLFLVCFVLAIMYAKRPVIIPNENHRPWELVNDSTALTVRTYDSIECGGRSYAIPMELSIALRNIVNS